MSVRVQRGMRLILIGFSALLLLFLRKTVLPQERHDLVSAPEVVIDLAILGLADSGELDCDRLALVRD